MKCRIARQMIRSRFVLGLAAAALIGTGAASAQDTEWKFVPVHVSPCAYIPAYCKRLELSENENCRTKSSDPGATCTLTVNATKRFTPHQCESTTGTSGKAPGEGSEEAKPASFVLRFLKELPEVFEHRVGLALPSRSAIRVKSFSSGLVAIGCDGPENSIHARMIKAAGDCDSSKDLTALTATPQSSGSGAGAVEIEGVVDADLPWAIKLTPKGKCSLEAADTTASGEPPGEITVQIKFIYLKRSQIPQPVLSEVQLEGCGSTSPVCSPKTDTFAKLKECLDTHRNECQENGIVTFDVRITPETSQRYNYEPNCDDSRSRLYGVKDPVTNAVEKPGLWLDTATFEESFEIVSFSPELTAFNCKPGDLVFHPHDNYGCPTEFKPGVFEDPTPAHVENQIISLRGGVQTERLGALYLRSQSDTCSIRSPSNERFNTLLMKGRLNIRKLLVDPDEDGKDDDGDDGGDSDNGDANNPPGSHQAGAKPPPEIPPESQKPDRGGAPDEPIPGGGNPEEGNSEDRNPVDETLELEIPVVRRVDDGASDKMYPGLYSGEKQPVPEDPSSAAAAAAAAIPTIGGAALGSGAATLGIALAISLHNIL